MKKITYLALAALVAMLILAPAALAQDARPGDDDPLAPEQNVVVLEEDALEQAVGKQIPEQIPDEPIDERGIVKCCVSGFNHAASFSSLSLTNSPFSNLAPALTRGTR